MTSNYKSRTGRIYPQGIYRCGLHIRVDATMLRRIEASARTMNVSRAEAARIMIENGLANASPTPTTR